MFTHNFKYALKTLFKNKTLIFWTFAFPLILATFFNMAFSNISNSEKLDIIDIAIVNNREFKSNEVFPKAFATLSDKKNKDRLFNIKYVSEKEANTLLQNEKIVGYMKLVNQEPKIIVSTSGIDQTIFKYVSEEIQQTNKIIQNLSEEEIKKEITSGNVNIDYQSIYTKVIEMTKADDANIKDISNRNLDYIMIEFYTLIAMTCMYGGILGMFSINQTLANMSNKGKRVAIAPTKKNTVILSSLLASYFVQLLGLFLLFIYTAFVLKVNYGNHLFHVILLSLTGSFTGLSLGIFIGSLLKANENTKTGILIAITMFGCFLSGMFGVSMKYIVDKHVPIINQLNPVAMITDGFYSLYYYDTFNRYWFNIISLLGFAFVLVGISFLGLRRQKYDSI